MGVKAKAVVQEAEPMSDVMIAHNMRLWKGVLAKAA